MGAADAAEDVFWRTLVRMAKRIAGVAVYDLVKLLGDFGLHWTRRPQSVEQRPLKGHAVRGLDDSLLFDGVDRAEKALDPAVHRLWRDQVARGLAHMEEAVETR